MNANYRKFTSLGIICCLMVSSVGCYTLQSVDNPMDVSGQSIFVKTRDKSIYELDEWEVLQNKNILGKGIRKQPIYGTEKLLVTEYEGVLSSRTIVEISTEEFDKLGTIAAGMGSVAGLAMVGGFVYLLARWRSAWTF